MPLLIVTGLCAWAGVLLQLVDSIRGALAQGTGVGHGLVLYFGYFTILTNLFAALVLTVTALRTRPVVATTAAVSILVVAIIYVLLLRATWNPQGLGAIANVLLHYVTPALFVLWWWLRVPRRSLRFRDVPTMLVYPVAYCVYALIRGALTGLYPYPFADVSVLGFPRAMLNTLAVLAAFAVVATAFVSLKRAAAIGPRR